MIVVPAIDVRGGKVVRLKQGLLREEKVYGADPAEAARQWAAEGATRLHVVDLDAAIVGRPQFDAIARVIAAQLAALIAPGDEAVRDAPPKVAEG